MKKGLFIQNLSFGYDEKADVLKDINLSLHPGEFVGIIGPNGAGKTTLLRCISGYLKPSQGQVLLDDTQIRKLSINQLAKKMALVPQHSALEYDFSVQDIVLTGRNPYIKRLQDETEQDYEIANDAMKKAGVYELKKRSVLSLSGGEWQRMIVARALCQQSDIMLLDEPVSSLDIKHQVEILSIVKMLTRYQSLTAICVLHDLTLTYNYCDRVILLCDNEVYAEGKPIDVLTQKNLQRVYDTDINIIQDGQHRYIFPQMS